MEPEAFFFNILDLIFGFATILSVIVLYKEFKNSNRLRRLKEYNKIIDTLLSYLNDILKNNFNLFKKNNNKIEDINECLRYLILIRYNLNLKTVKQINISISKILEFFFNFRSKLSINELKELKTELKNLSKFLIKNFEV